MITLEQVLESYTNLHEYKTYVNHRQSIGRDVRKELSTLDEKEREYLYNVRQYDLFHPAIQVGKDIGA